MGFYGDCPGANERLLAEVRKHPERRIPFVAVDPKLDQSAVEELERCLADYVHAAAGLIKTQPDLYACTCVPRAGDLRYLVKMGGAGNPRLNAFSRR